MWNNIVKYQHTQIGRLIIFVFLAVIILFGSILTKADFEPVLIPILVLILFIIASFSTLNVVIDENYVRIKFGYGIFRKRFALKEISSVKAVKNHWYYGWGIRVWFWPYMWIYNVSGFDAVEIILKNGKRYRIGTDEPSVLESALKREVMSGR